MVKRALEGDFDARTTWRAIVETWQPDLIEYYLSLHKGQTVNDNTRPLLEALLEARETYL